MNDIEGPAYRSFARTRSDYQHYHAVYQRFARSPSYLLRVLWPHWISLQELVAPSSHSYVAELRHNYLENPAAWDRFAAQLDRLAEIGRSRHVCVVVFVHTALARLTMFHPLRSIYQRVAEAARARGLHAVQSLPAFLGWDEAAVKVRAYDPHPNRQGHALLARALLEGLETLPPECRHWR